MKVYIYPADRFGCGALRAIWVGQALALQGHDAVVVPPDAAGTRTALGMISQGNGLEGKVDASGRTVAVSAPDDADVIVLQRVTHAGLAGAIPIWRRCGIAVVVDIDDDLSAIHPSNPAWAGLHPKTGKKGFSWLTAEQACADATLVTVSTPALLARYAPHGRGIVVPNTVPAEYFSIGERAQAMRSGPPVVGWGGSVGSHPDDLQAVGGAIERHVADGGRFTVVGPQEGVARALGLGESGWKATGGVSLAEWPATLARELSVGLAPLADTRFNAAKCVDLGMRICTDRGIIEAGDILPGMSVWRDRWRKVEAVEHSAPCEGSLLTMEDGYQLRLTPEHRMMVNGDWVRVKDVRMGDVMEMESEVATPKEPIRWPWPADGRMSRDRDGYDPGAFLLAEDGPTVAITPRWGRFLGAFAGDGSCGQSTMIQISCDGQDQDWIDLLMGDLKAFGFNPRTEKITTFNGEILRRRGVRVSSAHFLRVLESWGVVRSRENGNPIRVVTVPEVIWRSPREVIAEFLAGYFEADGTCTRTGVSATSKDEQLIRDVQRLLLAFGIKSRVSTKGTTAQNGFVGQCWQVTLRRADADIFAKEIGFRSARKIQKLDEVTSRPHSNAYRPQIWSAKVISIEPCEIRPVDIQVEGSTYVAAGFVSHNSWLKPLEYAALGIPSVVSPRAEYRRLRDQHGIGVIASKPKDWIKAIRKLTTDDAWRRDVAEIGRFGASQLILENNAWRWWEAWAAAMEWQKKLNPTPASRIPIKA